MNRTIINSASVCSDSAAEACLFEISCFKMSLFRSKRSKAVSFVLMFDFVHRDSGAKRKVHTINRYCRQQARIRSSQCMSRMSGCPISILSKKWFRQSKAWLILGISKLEARSSRARVKMTRSEWWFSWLISILWSGLLANE